MNIQDIITSVVTFLLESLIIFAAVYFILHVLLLSIITVSGIVKDIRNGTFGIVARKPEVRRKYIKKVVIYYFPVYGEGGKP